jgi:hypothetical protein
MDDEVEEKVEAKEVIEADASDMEPKRSSAGEGDDSIENSEPSGESEREPDIEVAYSYASSPSSSSSSSSSTSAGEGLRRRDSLSSSLGVAIKGWID